MGLIIVVMLLGLASLFMDWETLDRVILVVDFGILVAVVWGIYRAEQHHREQMALSKEELRLMKAESR